MRIRVLLVALLTVLGGFVAAPAATATGNSYTWIGGTGTPQGDNESWNDAKNWSPTGVPGNGDSVTIAPPSANDCHAHVIGMPTVQLANLTLADNALAGSVCLASLTGGHLSITHSFTWHGGVLDATTDLLAGSSGTISPTVDVTSELDSSLTVAGTLLLNGNIGGTPDRSLLMAAGVTLTIASGASMTTSNNNHLEALSCCTHPAKVVDNATITDLDNLSFDGVELDQHGTLDAHGAQAYVLSWAAPTTSTAGAHYTGGGTYRVSGESIVDAITGTQHIDKGFRFVLGGGSAPYSDPAVPADGNETIGGDFTLAGAGTFQWVGGHIYGNATVSTTGGASIGGNAEPKYLSVTPNNGRSSLLVTVPLTVAGGTHASPSYINMEDGMTITLAGRTAVGPDVRFYHGRVTNTGNLTINATGGHPVYAEAAGFSNKGTLTIAGGSFLVDDDYVQSAGSTVVGHGTQLREGGSSSVVRIEGGALSGSGTVTAPVSLTRGQITPGGTNIGTLTITGRYTQGAHGTASFDLAGGSGDQLSVHGAASIGGTIAVHNHYRPAAGRTRTLLTSSTSVSSHPSCVRTSGPGSTGSAARHWTVSVSGRHLVAHSVKGRRTTC